jgi:hypothetical protein
LVIVSHGDLRGIAGELLAWLDPGWQEYGNGKLREAGVSSSLSQFIERLSEQFEPRLGVYVRPQSMWAVWDRGSFEEPFPELAAVLWLRETAEERVLQDVETAFRSCHVAFGFPRIWKRAIRDGTMVELENRFIPGGGMLCVIRSGDRVVVGNSARFLEAIVDETKTPSTRSVLLASGPCQSRHSFLRFDVDSIRSLACQYVEWWASNDERAGYGSDVVRSERVRMEQAVMQNFGLESRDDVIRLKSIDRRVLDAELCKGIQRRWGDLESEMADECNVYRNMRDLMELSAKGVCSACFEGGDLLNWLAEWGEGRR